MQATHYETIEDLSLHNWRKCSAGKLGYTRIKWNEGTDEQDLIAWEAIQDTFIAEFGIGETMQEVFDLEKEIAELYCEIAESEPLDRFPLNKIAFLEHQLEELRKDNEGSSLSDCIGYVSKWMGTVINPKDVSTLDFYSWLKTMQAENDAKRSKALQKEE